MARAKKNTQDQPLTTAQQLGSLIKSARDTMRKDKGLNGDIDRLPMLTWILFLKFLDDLEKQREQEASLEGKRFRPLIETPYRWRDWAGKGISLTGPELLAFINQDEAPRPDGKRGPGLFAYLKNLQSADGRGREEVVANVFRGVVNRMESGYLLREIVDKVETIHFTSSEEIHTLSRLYEAMLREMRDAAGDSGEFYTPRPVVEFMVAVTDPKLGEVILDPACGTGGFLVAAFQHLEKQCRTVANRTTLQKGSLLGQEAKPLPFLLVQMNLLLHGLEFPQIDYGNSLTVKITELGDRDRVDVILTNPPFGGEEEARIKTNFPADMQTAETTLLFLQLIMRKLRRPERNHGKPGRAAVVVPNGTLFGDGVCARIKEQLLKEFNLHTIVRLPNGVFAPYTAIPTNLLFFDRSGPTSDIWYYELPIPEGRKNYSKTQPIRIEEFADCITWWNNRAENERAWKVDFKKLLDETVAMAQPHWDAAEAAKREASQLMQQAKDLARKISDIREKPLSDPKEKKTILAKVDALEVDRLSLVAQAQEQTALSAKEKADGDAIYWPIFNLDRKNPSAAQDLEHQPPEKLVESILAKEHRFIELMNEIKASLSAE